MHTDKALYNTAKDVQIKVFEANKLFWMSVIHVVVYLH